LAKLLVIGLELSVCLQELLDLAYCVVDLHIEYALTEFGRAAAGVAGDSKGGVWAGGADQILATRFP
jgi:hypothetical protein